MNINEKLSYIQATLKAPKSQHNSFGNYNYRSCEDILEAVKPLLQGQSCVLLLKDEVIAIGGRCYIKATATLADFEGNTVSCEAFAREPESKKGMDDSQITGATSSYARKYALNGLFAIDDSRDADATNTHGKEAANTHGKEVLCDDCGEAVRSVKKRDGAMWAVEDMIKYSKRRYDGHVYCADCMKKHES